MKIKLVDSTFSHCEVSSNPLPIVNKAKYIEWVREDSKTDLVVYTDNQIQNHTSNQSIAWLIEPEEIQPKVYDYIRGFDPSGPGQNNHYKFKEIWTHDKRLLESISNARFYPFGGCWIESTDRKIHSKTKLFSIISSEKNATEGHRLRHKIINGSNNRVDIFGRGYQPIDNKIIGLKDYYYHFVIENVKRDYWFTEKLIDSFITGTIPVFWGCPSIGDFFNTDGMIIFNDILELKQKLKQCTVDFYNKNLSAIHENFELAKQYTLAEDWIYNNIITDDKSSK